MASTLPFPDADLRAHPPRSSRAMLAGLVFVPRTIDKMRAKIAGTLGEYKIGPGLSIYLFEWLGITEEQFEAAVREAATDNDVGDWLTSHTDPSVYASINERLSARAIRDEAHFAEVLPRYPVLREYPHLRNWFEILDLDDRWIFDPANAEKVEQATH